MGHKQKIVKTIWVGNILGQTKCGSKKILGQKKFGSKKIWIKKNVGKKKMGQKNLGQKHLGQIFFGMKHLVRFKEGCIPKISFQGNLEMV